MTVSTRISAVSTISTAGLLFGAAILPAGSAFAADGCGADATLVAPGICEVSFTETPDAAWTPPAGITKIQALLVGAGGAGHEASGDSYGGGGGGVELVELDTTGAVTVTVGFATDVAYDAADNDTVVAQGSDVFTAEGGRAGHLDRSWYGGTSGNGFDGYNNGGGAGSAPDSTDDADVGDGLIVNEIDPATFALFANNDDCYGAGGAGYNTYTDGAIQRIQRIVPECNTAYLVIPETTAFNSFWDEFTGSLADVTWADGVPNSGSGGVAVDSNVEGVHEVMGEDGKVVIRYDVALAATGFDATASATAGATLVVGGAVIATRRRRASR